MAALGADVPNFLSARSRSYSGGGGGRSGENERGRFGNHACYGIVSCAVTTLLFCALAAAVSLWMAFVFAGLAMAGFAVFSFLAPPSWRVGSNDNAERESSAAGAGASPPAQPGRFGLTKATISSIPTFAYKFDCTEAEHERERDLEAGDSSETCSVCLEDVQAGEMVRQLPACKHLFHVGCIDMWLHSHRTCPVCRSNLSPPPKVPGKAAAADAAVPAAETAEAQPAAQTMEAEPPADHAMSPV